MNAKAPAAGATGPLLERAALYRFLALVFQPPHVGTGGELRAIVPSLPPDLHEDGTGLADAYAPEVETEYHRLFGGGGACRDCESDFSPPSLTGKTLVADVAGFYRAFRFEGAKEVPAPPDHLATELSFLGYLSLKAAYARHAGLAEEEQTCREAAEKFSREHLGAWLAEFLDRVDEAAPAGFYRAASRFAREALGAPPAAGSAVPIASPSRA